MSVSDFLKELDNRKENYTEKIENCRRKMPLRMPLILGSEDTVKRWEYFIKKAFPNTNQNEEAS